MMLKVLVGISLVSVVLGYPTFKALLPNGDSVPNPCGNGIWRGVGHLAEGGAGPLNPFGAAFKANGLNWDRTLCMADSDGDGKTNGEELGDPGCQWTIDRPTRLTAPTGHPGICEPVGRGACVGSAFRC